MPSQPIVTWITPCSSRSVKLADTRTRRHTIGLMPTSQTLSCRTTSIFTAASGEGSILGDGFSRRFIRPDYRLPAQLFQGTPGILMLSKSWELRTSTSLARLWQSQGKRQDAYELLGLDPTVMLVAKSVADQTVA